MLFPDLSRQPTDYFEKLYHGRGYRRIAGIDEAGRGPLAGPVVAAAVVLPEEGLDLKLFDSKQIPSKKRDELYQHILERALGIGIGIVSPHEIDRLNILQATLKAMVQAVETLPFEPDLLLIDGRHRLPLSMPQQPLCKGDRTCNSIAAASIVAKVTRDGLMMEGHRRYPQYNFAKHKGYGTAEHRKAIERYGVCELHRKTFRGVKEYLREA
ncbi:MAG: ribonuclease HII [Desulfobacterota bacterium]|nr:ribonuclease HII [Thermodesulfobacteriota bacterium]